MIGTIISIQLAIATYFLYSIDKQITEIRSHPQTYCIKYKPMGE